MVALHVVRILPYFESNVDVLDASRLDIETAYTYGNV